MRLAGLVFALGCPAAWALPAQYGISQLYHTRWTAQDGVPTGIESIVQTTDGFLWLGTSGGLFRFDGVEFERFSGAGGVALLSQDISWLLVAANGGLWIGHHLGGVSHLDGGHLVNYGQAQGLPRSSVMGMAIAADGTLWVGTTRGLYRLEGERWQPANATWNLPADPVDEVVLDRDRTLWMMSNDQIFYLRAGATRFERLPVVVPRSNSQTMLLHPDGVAVVCTSARVRTLTLTPPPAPGAPVPGWVDRGIANSASGACAFDREGHLWVAGAKGAARGEGTGFVPLSGESVSRILEDREGNMWFATRGGLDRFRAPAFLKLALDAGSNEFWLAPAAQGGAWIGSALGGVFRAQRDSPQPIGFGQLAGTGLAALYSDPSGTLWAAGGDSLWKLRADRRWQRLPHRGARTSSSFNYAGIQAMTQDPQGAMWVSVLRVGVYRVTGDEWTLWGGRTDMPTHNVSALFTDARGRVWFGYDDGEVTVLDGDRLAVVLPARDSPSRLALGSVETFAEQADHLWIGTEKGLWRLTGDAIHPVAGPRGAFIRVKGIVPGPAGDLWASTADGMVHIAAAELAQAFRDPEHRVRHELLDHLDGLPGAPETAVGNGGRLWITAANGVAWTDPGHLPRNVVAPTVILKSITADGVAHAFDAAAATPLPVRTRDLKIAYTATSLTMPERVRFRYRLGDEHAEWQDGGTRREASFRDLAPGTYRFQVIAANNDGVWNDTGASLSFTIPPTFVQTGWFVALCATAAAAAVCLLFAWRLRVVKARLRLRWEGRTVERERIARELHDTFLQAVQGLVIRFHAAMEQIPPHERSRDLMRNALDLADEVLADGRDAVTDLREVAGSSANLADGLQSVGEHWAVDTGVSFAMSIDGAPRDLDPVCVPELQRIATEALSNAFRHAAATGVQLGVVFASRQFRLRIADNGHGFDPRQLHAGRWGLVGMRERADRLNGRLCVHSDAHGTTVTLEVPARIAYARGRHGWHRGPVRDR
jgi:signal transduction histidine kinase